jgi:hypothetical protein
VDRFDYTQIEHMMPAIRRYIDQHIRPGHFLTAVLSNDLIEAVGHADDVNLWLLPVFVTWLYNEAPSTCWGSPEHVNIWLAERRTETESEATV